MRKYKDNMFVENTLRDTKDVGFVENPIGKNRMILEFGTETEKYLYQLRRLYHN